GETFGALRYHWHCWNAEAKCHLPALVAAVIHPLTHQRIATHRTYLWQQDGEWVKARLEAPKKLLGPSAGGIIPLTRGATRRRFTLARPPDRLLLAEGIENALTVAQWYPEHRTIAYLSAGNLLAVDLPEAFTDILLVRDRDGENIAVNQA